MILRELADRLDPFQIWMVNSNLRTIRSGEESAESIVSTLVANGYPSVAAAVKAIVSVIPPKEGGEV